MKTHHIPDLSLTKIKVEVTKRGEFNYGTTRASLQTMTNKPSSQTMTN